MELTDAEIRLIAERQRIFSLMGSLIDTTGSGLELVANVDEYGAHAEPAVRGEIESVGIFRRPDMLAQAAVKNEPSYRLIYDIASLFYWVMEIEKITG
jgi:hypothetical protein